MDNSCTGIDSSSSPLGTLYQWIWEDKSKWDQLSDQSKEIPTHREEMPRQVGQVPSIAVPNTQGPNSVPKMPKKKETLPPTDQVPPNGVSEPRTTTRSERISKKPVAYD